MEKEENFPTMANGSLLQGPETQNMNSNMEDSFLSKKSIETVGKKMQPELKNKFLSKTQEQISVEDTSNKSQDIETQKKPKVHTNLRRKPDRAFILSDSGPNSLSKTARTYSHSRSGSKKAIKIRIPQEEFRFTPRNTACNTPKVKEPAQKPMRPEIPILQPKVKESALKPMRPEIPMLQPIETEPPDENPAPTIGGQPGKISSKRLIIPIGGTSVYKHFELVDIGNDQ